MQKRHKKPREGGFSHLIAIVGVAVLFGVIGVFMLVQSRAQVQRKILATCKITNLVSSTTSPETLKPMLFVSNKDYAAAKVLTLNLDVTYSNATKGGGGTSQQTIGAGASKTYDFLNLMNASLPTDWPLTARGVMFNASALGMTPCSATVSRG